MCRLRTSFGPRAGLVRASCALPGFRLWFPVPAARITIIFKGSSDEKLPCCGHLYLLVLSRNFRRRLARELLVTNFAQFCPWMGHQQDSNTWLRLLDWNVRSHWLWQRDTSQQSFQTVHFRYLHECCVYMVVHSKNMFKLMFKTYDFHYGATCVYMVFTCSQNVFKTGFVQKSSEFHWGYKLVWLFRHVGVRSSMRENIPVPKLVQLARVPVWLFDSLGAAMPLALTK